MKKRKDHGARRKVCEINNCKMGKELTKIKAEIRAALKAEDRYNKGMEFRIGIAAGAALLHKKLLDDIEKLKSPVIRDGEDMDFVPAPDEAVRLLPHAAKEYHNALVALGLADGFIDDSPKVGRPAKEVPVSNAKDEVRDLIAKTLGEEA